MLLGPALGALESSSRVGFGNKFLEQLRDIISFYEIIFEGYILGRVSLKNQVLPPDTGKGVLKESGPVLPKYCFFSELVF